MGDSETLYGVCASYLPLKWSFSAGKRALDSCLQVQDAARSLAVNKQVLTSEMDTASANH